MADALVKWLWEELIPKVVGSNPIYWDFTFIGSKNCSLFEKTKINVKEAAGMAHFYNNTKWLLNLKKSKTCPNFKASKVTCVIGKMDLVKHTTVDLHAYKATYERKRSILSLLTIDQSPAVELTLPDFTKISSSKLLHESYL